MHRREARIAAALPASVPAPRFLGSYDDGDWIALIFEDIDGTAPRTPWQQPELDRVLVAVGELSSALTPAPIAVEPVSELMPSVFAGWQRLAPSAESRQDDLRGVDPWAQRHLAQLAALEAASPDAAAGTTLLHADMRADNILLTPSGVFFIDWPWASRGAAWVDLLFMLPSVAMQGGPKTLGDFRCSPSGAERASCRRDGGRCCGGWIHDPRVATSAPAGPPDGARIPARPGNPALEWLKRRTGWT